MVREILRIGHPVLRQRARPLLLEEIGTARVQSLIDDMIETMRAARGAGLAAPQVGESIRICILEVSENERYPTMPGLSLRIWINPALEQVSASPTITMYEGCLSVPALRGRVQRPGHVRVTSLDRHGKAQIDEFRGPLASVAAHEIDHLDGALFVDRADTSTFCNVDEFHVYVKPEERIVVSNLPGNES